MAFFRIAIAAELLGVSNDTVRRWIDSGTLSVRLDESNVKVVDGVELAALCRDRARGGFDPIRRKVLGPKPARGPGGLGEGRLPYGAGRDSVWFAADDVTDDR